VVVVTASSAVERAADYIGKSLGKRAGSPAGRAVVVAGSLGCRRVTLNIERRTLNIE
jgi:hypothetical protein